MSKKETVTVADFILSSIADVMDQFEDPLSERCIKLYKKRHQNKEKVNLSFFTNHSDAEVRKLAIDLTSTPFIYSINWKEKHGMDLRTQPDPEDNFQDLSVKTVLLFKYDKIGRQINKNKKAMAKLADNTGTKMMHHIKLHQKLLELRKQIASQLKTVVME